MSKNINYEECLALALDLASKAGKHLLKRQKHLSSLQITMKKAQGIASNADDESEK